MSLHVPPAPAPALRAVLTALNSPTLTRQTRTPTLRNPATITPVTPHPVHTLHTTPLPLYLPTAPPTRWRFLISVQGTITAAVETSRTPDGSWVFSHLSEGPFVTSTEHALRHAHPLPAPYQPRLLSVPGLYMLALWLHTDTVPHNAADILVPLSPAPPGIAADTPHRADDLLPILTTRLTPTPQPA